MLKGNKVITILTVILTIVVDVYKRQVIMFFYIVLVVVLKIFNVCILLFVWLSLTNVSIEFSKLKYFVV